MWKIAYYRVLFYLDWMLFGEGTTEHSGVFNGFFDGFSFYPL